MCAIHLQERNLVRRSRAQLVPSAGRWACPTGPPVSAALRGGTAAPRDWLRPPASVLPGKHGRGLNPRPTRFQI